MKVIKKPEIKRGVCTTCGAEYLVSGKDLRKSDIMIFGHKWLKCKFCKKNDVKVFSHD